MATTTEPDADAPSVPRTTEPQPPLDVVFGLLSSERRRRTLRYLLDETGDRHATLGALAEHIASIENDKPEQLLSSMERKRVYISLYQSHLPKLDDADVVDFDSDRKTIELAENADVLARFLAEIPDQETTREEADSVGVVASIAAWLPVMS